MTYASPRPELVGKMPYGAPQLDVPVRLNTNESPFPPSPATVEAMVEGVRQVAEGLNRYPDRDARRLRGELAAYLTESTGHPLSVEQVWAANGSNEVLQQLMLAYGGAGRTVAGFEPSYAMHREIAESSGARYVALPRAEDFGIDVPAASALLRETDPDVVFLCTPNNPTGGSLAVDEVLALYDACTGLVVLDEAYVEYSHRPSLLPLLAGRPRLVVSRTMSKAFGFAGVRLGYLAADPAVVDVLQLVRLPYHLSAVTQAVALAALAHRADALAAVEAVKAQRDRLVRELEALGLETAPSDSNFVLFRPRGAADKTWAELLERGVLIRDVGLDGWLRVTAGSAEENTRFLAALAELS